MAAIPGNAADFVFGERGIIARSVKRSIEKEFTRRRRGAKDAKRKKRFKREEKRFTRRTRGTQRAGRRVLIVF
jgi:hypothetical protein